MGMERLPWQYSEAVAAQEAAMTAKPWFFAPLSFFALKESAGEAGGGKNHRRRIFPAFEFHRPTAVRFVRIIGDVVVAAIAAQGRVFFVFHGASWLRVFLFSA
jgi:hypothetical protein